MNAVGIDVSKGKSTVAVLRPFGEVAASPFDVIHNDSDLKQLASYALDRRTELDEYIPADEQRKAACNTGCFSAEHHT